jgi:hypothetical protein
MVVGLIPRVQGEVSFGFSVTDKEYLSFVNQGLVGKEILVWGKYRLRCKRSFVNSNHL